MGERHDPSACRRILREAREQGLSRKLFDLAQDLQDGVYRAEALCGLCCSDEMGEEDRDEWVSIIIESMMEEERAWRLAESVGIIAKSSDGWPGGRARRTLLDNLISISGGLPEGPDRIDALKAISNRVSEHKLPELLLLAVENQGMEAKAARPVMKAIVATKNMGMISEMTATITEASPNLSVKLLDILHQLTTEADVVLDPTALEIALPLLNAAEFETVRILCSHASKPEDVRILAESLDGEDEEAIRFAATLAGRADRSGDANLARELLEKAAARVDSLDLRTATRIKKNLAKGFVRLGDKCRAEELIPVYEPRQDDVGVSDSNSERCGHTMALVGTYDGSIGTAHLRALARAAGIAWGFGLDIALIDWPTEDLGGLCQQTQKESGTAGVNHLPALLATNRIRLLSAEEALSGVVGHPIATTHQPEGGSVDLKTMEGNLCMMIGLGKQGLPQRLLDNCPDQFELTGVGASLETAVAMGAIAQRLADL